MKKCISLQDLDIPLPVNTDGSYPILTYFTRANYEDGLIGEEKYRPANVSFLWNLEGAENEGYYWIDDLDYGEKITLIPEEPELRGYKFKGWYKEPECINLWDFETDTTPAAQYDEDGNLIYQETCLYAGWD